VRYENMQWTDRIRQVKIILVIAATIIVTASLVVSHVLTRDLETEERHKMEIWAEAMRTLNQADENTDLNLVLQVINANNTIPVVVLDAKGKPQTARNINLKGKTGEDSVLLVSNLGQRLPAEGRVHPPLPHKGSPPHPAPRKPPPLGKPIAGGARL